MANTSNYGETGNSLYRPKLEQSTIDPNKEGLNTGLSQGLSLGMAGLKTGNPLLAAGGLAAGSLLGLMAKWKAKKQKLKQDTKFESDFHDQTLAHKESIDRNLRMNAAATGDDTYATNYYQNNANNLYMEKGGKLLVDITMARVKKEMMRRKEERIMRSGGSINIIPRGVTHAQKNKMGDNGIPIISNNKMKLAEIEMNELLINSESSKEIEELSDKYKKTGDKKYLNQLGRLLKSEITNNTVDLQGELL